jgi:hypothetical protein
MTGVVFVLCGTAAGVAEAILLARATRGRPHPLSFLGRLLLVAGVFVLAAKAGHLVLAAAGWALGFAAAAVVAYRRLR